MKISTRGRYGLRALLDLVAHSDGQCVTLKSIAERQNLSEPYLEQLMAVLKKADFVKSIRGSQGGYMLNVDPDVVTVGAVLRALEGALYPVECVAGSDTGSCGPYSCENCTTRPVWEKLYERLNDVLDSITLSQLVCKLEE